MTLEAIVRSKENRCLVKRKGVVAYPYDWQVPAQTEKAAYESICASTKYFEFDYFGFPWATIIDGLRGDASATWPILMALNEACNIPLNNQKRVTVAQHINTLHFFDLFKACGITDLFWSHATYQQLEFDGIKIHPFPLFPAQAPDFDQVTDFDRPRRYLANFIGAYNPSIYLSNVRELIFNDPNEKGDILIIKRDAWHFDRVVYDEQIRGITPDEQRLSIEQRQKEEYINAIKDSWFTLCPTGSGPNSIRIFESICLGSIPIILTKDLRLPGPSALWGKACIIEEDSAEGYSRALLRARNTTIEMRNEMLLYIKQLGEHVLPDSYCSLFITDF